MYVVCVFVFKCRFIVMVWLSPSWGIFGCIVYADDVLLLTHSVEALRHMLTICEDFAVDFDVKFNSNKSVL